VSPLWRPTPKMDRLLAESKGVIQELDVAVKKLERYAVLLNERTKQIEHEQESEGPE
jgi:hypothetical protein